MFSLISSLFTRLMQTGDVERQSLLHFGTSITVTILGFLVTMAITHLSGSADVPGGYFLFLSYLSIFSLISNGGLGGAAVQMMGRTGRKREYFSAYLVLRLFLLCISLIGLWCLSPVLVDLTAAGLLPWLIGAVIVSSLSEIAGTWVYGSGKVGYLQISTLINNLTRILIQFIVVLAGYGVAGLAGSVVAGLIVGAVVLLPLFRFNPARFSSATVRDLVGFSFWALLGSGGMIIYGNLDTILLGYYTTTADVGLYRIALQLASISLFAALALNTIFYPKFATWKDDYRKAWITPSLARAISYSLLLALPVCIGGSLLADRLLFFLYGSLYETAGTALILLLAAQVAYVFVFLWSMTLSALGFPRESAVTALLATAINIPLNLLLIPAFGITGAAGAILCTVIIHAISAGILLRTHISLSFDVRALRSIGISAVVMACFVLIFTRIIPADHAGIIGIVIIGGGLIYAGMLIRLERGIDTAIRRMIQEMGIVLPEWL